MKIPARVFVVTDKLILNVYGKARKPERLKYFLKIKKIKLEDSSHLISRLTTKHRATVTKTVWY